MYEERGRVKYPALFYFKSQPMENKQIILAHLVNCYESFEAEYRYLLHQKQQPERFRVIELSEVDLDGCLAIALENRDAFLEELKAQGYEFNPGE